MDSLESDLERARDLSVTDLADAIETIGFECTDCGACCQSDEVETDCCDSSGDGDPHTATIFPDEIRTLTARADTDWRDVARPMPYGLSMGPDGPRGQTFEWALQTDDCGDCTFYDSAARRCGVYESRPLICRTYPFSVALGGTSQPMGEAVDERGMVRAHECEGLGRHISREDAEQLARTLKERAIRELEEAIAVRENYRPVDTGDPVVVYDSEGPKTASGHALDDDDSEQGFE